MAAGFTFEWNTEILMTSTTTAPILPDYAPVPTTALGPDLNDQGYYVGRVERNLYWVTDRVYVSAFLTRGMRMYWDGNVAAGAARIDEGAKASGPRKRNRGKRQS